MFLLKTNKQKQNKCGRDTLWKAWRSMAWSTTLKHNRRQKGEYKSMRSCFYRSFSFPQLNMNVSGSFSLTEFSMPQKPYRTEYKLSTDHQRLRLGVNLFWSASCAARQRIIKVEKEWLRCTSSEGLDWGSEEFNWICRDSLKYPKRKTSSFVT